MQGIRTINYKWTILAFVFGILTSLSVMGCGKPMYVATLGADIYHIPDCKYVEQSLHKYGKIKRLNYHSNCHRTLSRRKPCPKCNP
ncbi:hypothetical protein LCGC14_2946300 [marine sediment metagenome]|uniref:Uncharacterized protein n=1 Tax=marine sediment metagenome TaxID=412755 RepID=A0A0F9A7R4_9ZZZZ